MRKAVEAEKTSEHQPYSSGLDHHSLAVEDLRMQRRSRDKDHHSLAVEDLQMQRRSGDNSETDQCAPVDVGPHLKGGRHLRTHLQGNRRTCWSNLKSRTAPNDHSDRERETAQNSGPTLGDENVDFRHFSWGVTGIW